MIPNPWIILAAALFWFSSCTGSYMWGYHNASNSAQVKAMRVEIAQKNAVIERLKQNEEANNKALQAYNTQLQRSEQALEVLKQGLKDYEDELAKKPPPPVCLFDPNDIDRLFGK